MVFVDMSDLTLTTEQLDLYRFSGPTTETEAALIECELPRFPRLQRLGRYVGRAVLVPIVGAAFYIDASAIRFVMRPAESKPAVERVVTNLEIARTRVFESMRDPNSKVDVLTNAVAARRVHFPDEPGRVPEEQSIERPVLVRVDDDLFVAGNYSLSTKAKDVELWHVSPSEVMVCTPDNSSINVVPTHLGWRSVSNSFASGDAVLRKTNIEVLAAQCQQARSMAELFDAAS